MLAGLPQMNCGSPGWGRGHCASKPALALIIHGVRVSRSVRSSLVIFTPVVDLWLVWWSWRGGGLR